MADMSEIWVVELDVDGKREERQVVISPPFGIRCADAEVKAIRSAEADGGQNVRAVNSHWLRDGEAP
jgi:hypothetical protein